MPVRDLSTSRPAWHVPAVVAALTVTIIAVYAPRAFLVLLTDGAIAAAILSAVLLSGTWLVALCGLSRAPIRWQLLLAAGLGIGALALLTLLFGLLGWLDRTLWIGLLIAMALSGLPRLVALSGRPDPNSKLEIEVEDGDPPWRTRNSKLKLLWLLTAPFAALALIVSTVPPGLLWAEEGNGYDALEYHLQMPREYLDAGRIGYAPHNVYANFPSNAEMLTLVAMIVQGDAVSGAMVGQIINALLAFLTIAAAWLAGREIAPAAGHVSGVLAATCGWLVYLSGIAYVENAMLFFGMLSAAAVARAARQGGMGPRSGPVDSESTRWSAMAGLLAGLAAGCKYTAVILIAIPLGLAVLALRWESHRRRWAAFAAFSVSAAAAFTPWMVKNAAFSGNPVFPLAPTVFRSYPEGWSMEHAEHFARCHAPAADESSPAFRVMALWEKVLADPDQRLGPLIFVLAVAGAFAAMRARDRLGVSFALALLAQIGIWLAFTHLYARFAVVFLIPLAVLGGAYFAQAGSAARRIGTGVLVAGAAWNLWCTAQLYRAHLYAGGQRIAIEGTTDVFTGGLAPGYEHLKIINADLPADSRILLVGEARAFYFQREVDYRVVFNHDPFVELLKNSPSPNEVRDWLAVRKFTHLYVAWSEIRRLSRSRYGFHGRSESDLRKAFEALSAGHALHLTKAFPVAGSDRAYSALYSVISRD